MKARIKKTGEIVNLAEYAKITLDMCDSYGNPIELKPEEVEFIQEKTDNIDWNQVRIQAAIAAMQGLITTDRYVWLVAEFAVKNANALIEELKREHKNERIF